MIEEDDAYQDFPPFPKVSSDFNPQTTTLNQENNQDQETIEIPDEEPILHVQKLTESAKVPIQQTDQAAGYDLYSAETATIEPNSRKLIGTNIAIAIPEGTYAHCRQEVDFSWVSPELMFFGLFQLFIGSVVNNAIIQKSD